MRFQMESIALTSFFFWISWIFWIIIDFFRFFLGQKIQKILPNRSFRLVLPIQNQAFRSAHECR